MAVRGFSRYLSAIDPRTEVPPAGLVSYRHSRRAPYLSSDEAVPVLVHAARASTPFTFRAETLTALIVLPAVTGLRVGEALRLDRCDVDWSQAVIKVRDTKFGKGRDVVVSASAVDALAPTDAAATAVGRQRLGCSCLSPALRSSTATSPTPSARP